MACCNACTRCSTVSSSGAWASAPVAGAPAGKRLRSSGRTSASVATEAERVTKALHCPSNVLLPSIALPRNG
eukprot:14197530-Alexandrium_andersonii.AAC.1